eukprot:1139625-Pelagomonas_calceolata.AAC.2
MNSRDLKICCPGSTPQTLQQCRQDLCQQATGRPFSDLAVIPCNLALSSPLHTSSSATVQASPKSMSHRLLPSCPGCPGRASAPCPASRPCSSRRAVFDCNTQGCGALLQHAVALLQVLAAKRARTMPRLCRRCESEDEKAAAGGVCVLKVPAETWVLQGKTSQRTQCSFRDGGIQPQVLTAYNSSQAGAALRLGLGCSHCCAGGGCAAPGQGWDPPREAPCDSPGAVRVLQVVAPVYT